MSAISEFKAIARIRGFLSLAENEGNGVHVLDGMQNCEGECNHKSCERATFLAAQPCGICNKSIGFFRRFGLFPAINGKAPIAHISCVSVRVARLNGMREQFVKTTELWIEKKISSDEYLKQADAFGREANLIFS